MPIIGKPELSEGLNMRCKDPSMLTLLFNNGNMLLKRMLAEQRAQRTALKSRWLLVGEWVFDS